MMFVWTEEEEVLCGPTRSTTRCCCGRCSGCALSITSCCGVLGYVLFSVSLSLPYCVAVCNNVVELVLVAFKRFCFFPLVEGESDLRVANIVNANIRAHKVVKHIFCRLVMASCVILSFFLLMR